MATNGSHNADEMSFLQHLEVLRWHLVRSTIAILIGAVAAFASKGFVFGTVIFGPKSADFITYRTLCSFSAKLHAWLPELFSEDALCIGQSLPNLYNFELPGQFISHIVVSIVTGIIVASPYILWEVWRFVQPALQPGERKHARGFVFVTSFLFLLGVLFGYFVISPLSVNFFLTYTVDGTVVNQPRLTSYVTIVTSVVLGCGLIFELPVLVYFLTRLGWLTPQLLRKYRKHALVVALIVSAIITPPDVFSQLLVSVPLLILYEISIWLSRLVVRRESRVAS